MTTVDIVPPDEENKSRKAYNVRNVDKNLLDLFWKLADTKEEVRINASLAIIRIVLSKQKQNENSERSDLLYTVDRLVRGMSSPRLAARPGFSVLLSQVLAIFPQVEIVDIIQLIDKHLPLINRQDKAATCIGRMLAYTAIVQSGRLQGSQYLFIIQNVYQLSLGREFLQVMAYKLLVQVFNQFDEESFEKDLWIDLKKDLVKILEKIDNEEQILSGQKGDKGSKKLSLDKLWLFLLIHRLYPGTVNAKFLKSHWGSKTLFAESKIPFWIEVISQSTSILPQLHPASVEILLICMQKNILKDLWTNLIDENLFNIKFVEKACLGFFIVKEALSRTQDKEQVKIIMSAKFCSVFGYAYTHKTSPLHSAAIDLAASLWEFIKNTSDSKLQILVLTSLLHLKQNQNFDQVMKMKEVSQMISHLNSKAVVKFSDFLQEIILQPQEISTDDDGNSTTDEGHGRHQAVLQIGGLVAHPSLALKMRHRMKIIKFLFVHSYFVVQKTTEQVPECESSTEFFHPSLRTIFQDTFARAIDSLNSRSKPLREHLLQVSQYLEDIMNFADKLISLKKYFKPLFPVEKIIEPWAKVKELSERVKERCTGDKTSDETLGLHILVLHLGLQLLKDAEHIPNILDELDICCNEAFMERKENSDTETDDSEPEWIQVVVDIMLSLMSQSSRHMRSVVTFVFPLVCPFMKKKSLELILEVICPAATDLSVKEEDGEDEDVEFESGSSDDDSDNKESADNDDDNKNPVSDAFKLKIQNALGPAVDLGEDDSDTVLTDSEMFKLDDALSEAFSSMKRTGHTRITSEEKNLMNFKTKCVDLVMIYLKEEPPLRAVLHCLERILSAWKFSRVNRQQSQLGFKALNALKIISKIRNFSRLDATVEDLIKLLDQFIIKCHKESDSNVRNVLYSLCIFLVRCERKIMNLNSDDTKENNSKSKCLEKYTEALGTFAHQRSSQMNHLFFTEFFNTFPEYAWKFTKPLVKYSLEESVRLYTKSQLLGLLLLAMRLSKSQKSVSLDRWLKFVKKSIPKLLEALSEAFKSYIKPVYITELLDVLLCIETISKEKLEYSVLKDHSTFLPMLASLDDKKCKMLGRKGKSLRRKLILMLAGSVHFGKRKQTDLEDIETNNTQVEDNELKCEIDDTLVNDEQSFSLKFETPSDDDDNDE